jgi:predicted TIM-barrel fold metal-dependent hydrolase
MDSLWGWLSSHKRQKKGTKTMSLTASEFFRRQCYIVAFPDDTWIPQCMEHVGEENVVLCTDFPHPGTTYRMKETFSENYPDLSGATQRKLLGANAERIFGL